MALSPVTGAGISIDADDTTGSASLGSAGYHVIVSNAGSSGCYVELGTSTVTATTADLYIPAGQTFVLARALTQTHIAAICDSGESTTVKACASYSE